MQQNLSLPDFFADTSNIVEIEKLVKLNLISGITTNPVIVAKDANGVDPINSYKRLAVRFPDFPISIQLLDLPEEKLLFHAKEFASIAPNIIVKLPMFGDGRGLRILPDLLENGININVTGLMTSEQALTVMRVGDGKGPVYVSLFFNRIRDGGGDPVKEINKTRNLIEMFNLSTKIITGSIRKPEDVYDAVLAGAHIVTITPPVFWAMINHPKSVEFIEQSQAAWQDLLKAQKAGNGETPQRKVRTRRGPQARLAKGQKFTRSFAPSKSK